MVKHILFLRWWLIMSATAIGAYFCNQFSLFQMLYTGDFTNICFLTLALFAIVSVWCGFKTYRLSSAISEDAINKQDVIDRIKNEEEVGWFAAGICTALGFLGTAIGMVVALDGFIGVDPTQVETMKRLIDTLVTGCATALLTTIVGLICSMIIQLQYFNLGYARRKLEETL